MSAKPRIKLRAGSHLGEVLTFPSKPLQNVMQLIAQIEEIAIAGDVDGIAIAFTHRDGVPDNFYVKGTNRWTLLGAVQRLGTRIEKDADA
jgi:hypothetical protein